MDKYILIRFFNGEATEQEIDSIIEWVDKSPENKRYFAEQKELYTALKMADVKPLEMDEVKGEVGDVIGKRPLRLRKMVFQTLAVAASCAIFFLIGWFVNKNNTEAFSDTRLVVATDAAPVMHELHTERGVKGFLVLPDGSKVWLNSDSKITYPEAFSGKSREVSIVGEGYFEVTKDSLRPMIVTTGRNFSIEVLGTSFNIKNYDNDRDVEATLYSGVIKAHFKNKSTSKEETVILKPNESFTYGSTSTEKPFNYDKPEVQKAWKDGSLIFEDTAMPEVIKMLERWHGTTFIVQNDKIYDYKLSAEFNSESIVQILEIMKLIMPIDYSYSDNTVTLK